MTNNGRRRTIDIDRAQQMKPGGNNFRTRLPGGVTNFPPVRSQRRLDKWNRDKTDELNREEEHGELSGADADENGPLVQSLSAMASHLMNTQSSIGDDDDVDNFENSSERDVYITEKSHGVTLPNNDDLDDDTEETASEEDSTDQAETSGNGERKRGSGELNDVGGGEEDDTVEVDDDDDGKVSPKLKSDHPTTPRGLTTWSAINGHHNQMYSSKVTVQKVPVEYTISSVLSFSTERPSTTQEMVVIQERLTPTTEPTKRITSKVNLMSPSGSTNYANKNRKRPVNKNNKKVAPSKFVKAPLEDVTAEVTSIDDTHVVYKTRVSTEAPELKSTGMTSYYDRFTTKKPLWPHQMTTRRLPSKRPVPFSRVTPKPKNPHAKRPQLSLTTPTTTTPPSTTTYLRQPQTAMISPISGLTLSLADIPFMDFVRSQIIPRIGLTLISFMASTPLLLSMLGAVGLRRRKRSLSSTDYSSSNGKALFESSASQQRTYEPDFDFSTIRKKLEDAIMKQPNKRRIHIGGGGDPAHPHSNNFDMITEAFRHLARWWATQSAPTPKSRSVNNGDGGKHK